MRKTLGFLLALLCIASACKPKTSQYVKTSNSLNDFDVTNSQGRSESDFSDYVEREKQAYIGALIEEIWEWGHPYLVGEVNATLYSKLYEFDDANIYMITSSGGYIRYGDKIASYMLENPTDLIVVGTCASACAEDILPAARKLYFYDEPLISFHGNAHSVLHHLSQGTHDDPCPSPRSQYDLVSTYENDAKNMSRRYKKSGHNIAFWKEQEKRLKGFSLVKKVGEDESCSMTSAYENADVWLPTSHQLKTLLGLEFEGTVCADNIACYEKKLYLLNGPGHKYIIGDEFYEPKVPEFR